MRRTSTLVSTAFMLLPDVRANAVFELLEALALGRGPGEQGLVNLLGAVGACAADDDATPLLVPDENGAGTDTDRA
jgi:hypothetical protein